MGAARTQKLVQTLFSAIFNVDFSSEITEKRFEMNKKGWKRLKKCFEQLSGVRSTRKLVKKHNKQQEEFPKKADNLKKNLASWCYPYSFFYKNEILEMVKFSKKIQLSPCERSE